MDGGPYEQTQAIIPFQSDRGKPESLIQFVQDNIEVGSTIRTDGWKGYNGLAGMGYTHNIQNQTANVGEEMLPLVHRIASLLKRWLIGTYQGAVREQHLDYYFDEHTFRFNRRTSSSRGKLFFRLVQQAMMVDPVPANQIVGGLKQPTTTEASGEDLKILSSDHNM